MKNMFKIFTLAACITQVAQAASYDPLSACDVTASSEVACLICGSATLESYERAASRPSTRVRSPYAPEGLTPCPSYTAGVPADLTPCPSCTAGVVVDPSELDQADGIKAIPNLHAIRVANIPTIIQRKAAQTIFNRNNLKKQIVPETAFLQVERA